MTLDEYKAARIADVQTELERRIAAAISPYMMTHNVRRAIIVLAKGTGATASDKTELSAVNTALSVIDPIETAAQAAKDRINALVAIPAGDDAFLLQW